MKPKAGDRIKIFTDDDIKEGILMPEKKEDIIVIKLDNGYNIGINNDKVKKIKILKNIREKEIKTKINIKKNKNKKTIAVLHTGGTIASKVDYKTGGVIASFSAEDFFSMFPEVKNIANIKSELVNNMMSEDMNFSHYNLLTKAIEKQIKAGVDGIIIGHGTDTLTVTSAALSFVFENLPIPVILVGSQRSTDRGSTDGAMNLICAAEFIAKTDFVGVAVCMHESTSDNNCLILPPCKTKKLHSSRRDAFKVVDDKAFARVNYKKKKIEFLKNFDKKSSDKLIIKDKFENKVAVLKVYPNMNPDFINTLINNKYRGVVLEGSGLGMAPTNLQENLKNYEALKKYISSGGIVLMTTNCIFGGVHENIYVNTRRLKDIGVIYGRDMLTETAFVKLAWLLGNYKNEEVKELITKNLRGEINDRLLEDYFLN